MAKPAELYEELVMQGDKLVIGIQTCEQCITLLLENLYRSGEAQNQEVYNEVMMLIHEVEMRLRKEWLTAEIQKALLAYEMKKGEGQA